MRLMGGSSHDEGDVPSLQVLLDVGQALIKEGVVAKVGVREVRDGGEVHEERQLQQIGYVYRQVDGVVVDSALRPLHPVDDASALGIGRPIPPHGDSRIVRQRTNFLR